MIKHKRCPLGDRKPRSRRALVAVFAPGRRGARAFAALPASPAQRRGRGERAPSRRRSRPRSSSATGPPAKRIVRLTVDMPGDVPAEAAVKAFVDGAASSLGPRHSPSRPGAEQLRDPPPRARQAGHGAVRGPLDRGRRPRLAQPRDRAGPRAPLERLSLPSFPHRHRLHRAPVARRPQSRRISRFRHQVLPRDRGLPRRRQVPLEHRDHLALGELHPDASRSRRQGPRGPDQGRPGRAVRPLSPGLRLLRPRGDRPVRGRGPGAGPPLRLRAPVGHEQRRQRLRLVAAPDLPPGRRALLRQRHQRDALPRPSAPAQRLLVGVARRQPHPPLERRALSLRQLRAGSCTRRSTAALPRSASTWPGSRPAATIPRTSSPSTSGPGRPTTARPAASFPTGSRSGTSASSRRS